MSTSIQKNDMTTISLHDFTYINYENREDKSQSFDSFYINFFEKNPNTFVTFVHKDYVNHLAADYDNNSTLFKYHEDQDKYQTSQGMADLEIGDNKIYVPTFNPITQKTELVGFEYSDSKLLIIQNDYDGQKETVVTELENQLLDTALGPQVPAPPPQVPAPPPQVPAPPPQVPAPPPEDIIDEDNPIRVPRDENGNIDYSILYG